MKVEPLGALEAILFTAGRSMEEAELAQAVGTSSARVRELLLRLAERYEGDGGALEVVQVGDRWSLQVKGTLRDVAAPWAPPDLPREVVRTAALIAYHQPIKQSRLVHLMGTRAYRDVTTLAKMKLISARASGHTLELTTTSLFPEYFGLRANSREEIKALLAKDVG